MGEFNVNKSDGSLEQTAGMPDTYPAEQVMLSDGVTSVEDALDDIYTGLMRMTKLWENPDPTRAFDDGNIMLSSSDYDLLLVLPRYSKSSTNTVPAYIGKKGYINFADWSGQSMTAMYRSVSASGTTATFSGASVNGTINNDYLIPTVIYGLKLTATM